MKKRMGKVRICRLASLLLVFVLVLASTLAILPSDVEAKTKKPELNKAKLSLTVGKSAALKVKKGSEKIKKTVWSSSSKKVAAVSKKGKITAKKKGTATITAKVTAGKKTYRLKCKVTVKSNSVPSVEQLFAKNAAESVLSRHESMREDGWYYDEKGDPKYSVSRFSGSDASGQRISYHEDLHWTSYCADHTYMLCWDNGSRSSSLYMDDEEYQEKIDFYDGMLTLEKGDDEKAVSGYPKRINGVLRLMTTVINDEAARGYCEISGIEFTPSLTMTCIYDFDPVTYDYLRSELWLHYGQSNALRVVTMTRTYEEPADFYDRDGSCSLLKSYFDDAAGGKAIRMNVFCGNEKKEFTVTKDYSVSIFSDWLECQDVYTDSALSESFDMDNISSLDRSGLDLYIPVYETASENDIAEFKELIGHCSYDEQIKKYPYGVEYFTQEWSSDGYEFMTDQYAHPDCVFYSVVGPDNKSGNTMEYFGEGQGINYMVVNGEPKIINLFYESIDDYQRVLTAFQKKVILALSETEQLVDVKKSKDVICYRTQIADEDFVQKVLKSYSEETVSSYKFESGMRYTAQYMFRKSGNEFVLKKRIDGITRADGKWFELGTISYFPVTDASKKFDPRTDSSSFNQIKSHFSTDAAKKTVQVVWKADTDQKHTETYTWPVGEGACFVVTDKDGNMEPVIHLYSDAACTSPVPDGYTAADGDTLYIRSDYK